MEIGIGDVDEVAVGSDVGGGREQAEARVLDDGVVASPILPHQSIRPAVALGNVEILLVGRNCDSMRAVDVSRHQPSTGLALNPRAAGAKPNEHNFVRRFANYIDQIVLPGTIWGN